MVFFWSLILKLKIKIWFFKLCRLCINKLKKYKFYDCPICRVSFHHVLKVRYPWKVNCLLLFSIPYFILICYVDFYHSQI
jgi:hypothetical protein